MNFTPLIKPLSALLGLTSIVAVTTLSIPARAYEVMLNGRQAGNPLGDLYDVTLDSTKDIGRNLDPVYWSVPAGTQGLPSPLSAVLKTQIADFTTQSITLKMTLQNTTDVSSWPNDKNKASIVSFGFAVSPDATAVNITGSSIFDTAIVQDLQKKGTTQTFPGGFKQIDVCIFADGCAGGNVNNGLQAGQETSFTLTIWGDFANKTTSDPNDAFITLSDFPIKFQTSYGSFEPAGVPEPLTILGSGMALGFGALYRKKLVAKQKKSKAIS